MRKKMIEQGLVTRPLSGRPLKTDIVKQINQGVPSVIYGLLQ